VLLLARHCHASSVKYMGKGEERTIFQSLYDRGSSRHARSMTKACSWTVPCWSFAPM
jgi:hypothetical protein